MAFKKGVLLINLGTPDSPNNSGLRRYLNQFLTDRRVIDLPWLFRHFLFRFIVVPIRSRKVSKLYQKLWMEDGSPLKVYGSRVVEELKKRLSDTHHIELAMRYQNPSIKSAIDKMYENNVSEILILPLFPQYSSSTTGSIFQEVMKKIYKKEQIPTLKFINSYHSEPDFIELYAENARKYDLGSYDHYIFSFHGVPKRYLKKENDYCKCNFTCCQSINKANQFCYSAQCYSTAYAISQKLGIKRQDMTVTFQSRFGPEEWTQPYTDATLFDLIDQGKKSVLVFSPAFIADCLETTIEIGFEYKEDFIHKGGKKLDLVPSLNDHPNWISFLEKLITKN